MTILVCLTFVLITAIICYTVSTYCISESNRALVNTQEKLRNLNSLMNDKDNFYSKSISDKSDELKRLVEIIKNLTDKNQNYNVNAKVNT